eukprot:231374-Prymnesium_polylepis.1
MRLRSHGALAACHGSRQDDDQHQRPKPAATCATTAFAARLPQELVLSAMQYPSQLSCTKALGIVTQSPEEPRRQVLDAQLQWQQIKDEVSPFAVSLNDAQTRGRHLCVRVATPARRTAGLERLDASPAIFRHSGDLHSERVPLVSSAACVGTACGSISPTFAWPP